MAVETAIAFKAAAHPQVRGPLGRVLGLCCTFNASCRTIFAALFCTKERATEGLLEYEASVRGCLCLACCDALDLQVASPPPAHDLERPRLTGTSARVSDLAGGEPSTASVPAAIRPINMSQQQGATPEVGAPQDGSAAAETQSPEGKFVFCASLRPSRLHHKLIQPLRSGEKQHFVSDSR